MRAGVTRRALMKSTVAGVAAGLGTVLGSRSSGAATVGESAITIAGYDYDRVRAIVDGKVGLPGSTVAFEFQNVYALNQAAFGPERPYEVTEIGLIPYVTKSINEGFRAYTLVPVFISRIFRHRNVYVHADAGIETPGDLRGKRVGTPGYGSSANTWIRGLLLDQYRVRPDEIQWIETAKSSDGGAVDGGGFNAFGDGDSPYFLPKGFPLVQGPPGSPSCCSAASAMP